MKFLAVEMLMTLWAVPLLAGAMAYAAVKRRQALLRFADRLMLEKINIRASATGRRWKQGLLLAAFSLCAVAAARPAWNPRPQ